MTYPQPITYNYAPSRNVLGLVALIIAIIGGVATLGVFAVPSLLFIAIPMLLVAFVLAIIGLTRRNQGKGTSIAALVLSVVLGFLGPILFAGSFMNFLGESIGGGTTEIPADTSQVAKIGEKVSNSAGVSFTVSKVRCGKSKFTDEFGYENRARGSFCIVSTKIRNDSNEEVTISVNDITGLIGEAKYEADAGLSDLGGERFLASINPGLRVNAKFVIDVPKQAKLEYIELRPVLSFQDAVLVKVG